VTPEQLGLAMTGAAEPHQAARPRARTGPAESPAAHRAEDPQGVADEGRFDPVRILPPIVAPIGALLIAVLVSALVLSLGGNEVFSTFQSMYEYGTRPDTINSILNKAVYYYFAR
jgi:hypothetical protein